MMKYFKLTMLGTVLAASLLSACGGGGDSAPAATATISGTAATGAAIAGGTVSMNCVSGASATTTTGTDGSYSMSVSGIVFPCVARVSYGTGNKLQTYVSAAGTANITSLTELILANLIGDTAANGFDKFDPAKAKLITAAQVTAATAAVKNYLTAQGISTADFPADPLGTKFVAKNGMVLGDKVDALLDALAAKLLAGGKKLSDAVADVAKGSSPTTSVPGSVSASPAGSGVFNVTKATVAARNGSFAVSSALGQLPSGNTNIDYNGNTADGKFEWDVQYTVAGVIKSAYIWYYEAGNSIVILGCNGGSVPCTGVTYDAVLKQVNFLDSSFQEITNAFPGPATLGTSGSSVTVNGSVSVK